MECRFYQEMANGVLLIPNVLETLRVMFPFSSKVFLVLRSCGVREERSPGSKVVQWSEESPRSQGSRVLGLSHMG